MLKCLFLIAVTAPIFVSCQTNTTNETCLEKIDVMKYGSAFLNALRTSINETLITDSTKNLNASFMPAANAFLEIINSTCMKNKTMPSKAYYADFVKVLDFSLANQKYKNFTATGGLTCINETRSRIDKCINQTVGHSNKTDANGYRKLLRKAQLFYTPSSCSQTKSLRNCTEKVLKNDTHCKQDHVAYVTSIFNFILETSPCANLTTEFKNPEERKSPSSASSVYFNTAVTLITLLITL